jgi:tetratricopeptide (TPR) repeat protein
MDDLNDDPLDYVVSCLEQGDLETALDTLNALSAQDQEPDVLGRLVSLEYLCYSFMGAEDAAGESLDYLHEFAKKDPDVIIGAAIQFFNLQIYEVAQFLLAEACREHPEFPRLHFLLALAAEELGDHQEAIALYTITIEADETALESHVGIARCSIEVNRIDDAIEACSRYLKERPEEEAVWVSMGRMLIQGERFDEASEACAKAAAAGGSGEAMYLFWSVAAGRQGDADCVEACSEAMREAYPESWASRIVEGYALGAGGDVWDGWETCVEGFEQACEEGEGDEMAGATDAVVHYALAHDLDDALAGFIPGLHETDTFTFTVLSVLRRAAGPSRDRAANFRLAIEGDITNPELIQAISKHTGEDPPFAFARLYSVLAESAEQAEEFVRSFELAGGVDAIRVGDIERLEGDAAGHLGVWKRSNADILRGHDVSLN